MARNTEESKLQDKEMGWKVYQLRIAAGMSRQQLGEKIGVTHQQLQKYEKGTNRISAVRLRVIAKTLGKKISYFYGESDLTEMNGLKPRLAIEVQRNLAKLPFKMQAAYGNLIRVAAEGL